MSTWKIACVQMDCQLGDTEVNLQTILNGFQEATRNGARLVVFPECAVTGYAFESKEEAWAIAEAVPGPTTEAIIEACRAADAYVIVGTLEQEEATNDLFNVAVLIGPEGVIHVYRKLHLPYLGVDRFTRPGNIPFAVQDIGGLRVGMTICYDGSFPEAARSLMLQGADLVALPTNYPTGAKITVQTFATARALENQVYYACCNRIGHERGFDFIGMSRIISPRAEYLACTEEDQPTILYAEIDPTIARNKLVAKIPGIYELHRTAHRRPEMYGMLIEPAKEKFTPSIPPEEVEAK
ncbi:MAG: carbon-nitrogen hydrolase family protein [Gemmataceae bacterium]